MTQDVQIRPKDELDLGHVPDPQIDPDDEQFARLGGEPLGRNLLDNRVDSGVMRSRWCLGVFQIPIAAVFGLVAY